MTIGIVGNGAIGNLLAYQCEQQDLNYCLITRDAQPLELTCVDHTKHGNPAKTFSPQCFSIQRMPSVDILIVPVKAYAVEGVLHAALPQLKTGAQLVLLHNGMVSTPQLIEIAQGTPVICATTSYAAFKASPTQVNITGTGVTSAGWLQKTPDIAAAHSLLNTLLPPCSWEEDIEYALWMKLAVNAVINPLTALYQVSNGELLAKCYQQYVTELCQETALVMQSCGYRVSVQTLVERCHQVMTRTAQNRSSMYMDVKQGRRTEIDFINGHIVKTAHQYHLDVPLNTRLCQAVADL